MSSTTFTDQQTVIYSSWLNDVNKAVYTGVFPSGVTLTVGTLTVGTLTVNLINIGTLSFTDTGLLITAQGNLNGYEQIIVQNTNSGAIASADYIVSNKKIEATGWKPTYTLDMGIEELMKAYQVLIPRMTSEFRNGFPLGYAQNF